MANLTARHFFISTTTPTHPFRSRGNLWNPSIPSFPIKREVKPERFQEEAKVRLLKKRQAV
jgi:hypothetical protein